MHAVDPWPRRHATKRQSSKRWGNTSYGVLKNVRVSISGYFAQLCFDTARIEDSRRFFSVCRQHFERDLQQTYVRIYCLFRLCHLCHAGRRIWTGKWGNYSRDPWGGHCVAISLAQLLNGWCRAQLKKDKIKITLARFPFFVLDVQVDAVIAHMGAPSAPLGTDYRSAVREIEQVKFWLLEPQHGIYQIHNMPTQRRCWTTMLAPW